MGSRQRKSSKPAKSGPSRVNPSVPLSTADPNPPDGYFPQGGSPPEGSYSPPAGFSPQASDPSAADNPLLARERSTPGRRGSRSSAISAERLSSSPGTSHLTMTCRRDSMTSSGSNVGSCIHDDGQMNNPHFDNTVAWNNGQRDLQVGYDKYDRAKKSRDPRVKPPAPGQNAEVLRRVVEDCQTLINSNNFLGLRPEDHSTYPDKLTEEDLVEDPGSYSTSGAHRQSQQCTWPLPNLC